MSRSGEEQTAGSEGTNESNGGDAPELIGVRRGMFGAEGSGDIVRLRPPRAAGRDAWQFTQAVRQLL
jgi:hypothetical protein